MLIEFTVGNFRSFKERVTLSMVAAKASARDPQVNINNTIFAKDKLTLLTSAAVYGANASGKSNLIRAMGFMKRLIINSSKSSQVDEPIKTTPYRLSPETENEPSFFEVVFILDGVDYRYGFEVNRRQVVSEWLFQASSAKELKLFIRDENGINISRGFKEGRGLDEKTRPNALFLSVVAQFNGQISTKVLGWFRQLSVVSGLDDTAYRNYTTSRFVDGKYQQQMIEMVKKLDIGVEDIFSEQLEQSKVAQLLEEMPDKQKSQANDFVGFVSIKTVHTKHNAQGESVGTQVFDLISGESDGTQKLFFLLGPILDTLSGGKILFIDEMEARFHPLLTHELIRLFNSLETNPKRAQLVFSTHDTNLLSNKFFRRDQIWFIEKDQMGASHLYSLAELKVRNDAQYEDDYIQGRYGAIPFIGGIKKIEIENSGDNDVES